MHCSGAVVFSTGDYVPCQGHFLFPVRHWVCVLLLWLYGTLSCNFMQVGTKTVNLTFIQISKNTTMICLILYISDQHQNNVIPKRQLDQSIVKRFTVFKKIRKNFNKSPVWFFYSVCVCVSHCFSLWEQGGQVAQPSRCDALTEVTCCLVQLTGPESSNMHPCGLSCYHLMCLLVEPLSDLLSSSLRQWLYYDSSNCFLCWVLLPWFGMSPL